MTPTIRQFLDTRIPTGSRNFELYRALCQCRDNEVDPQACVEKAIQIDGLTRREVDATARSIFGRAARPPAMNPNAPAETGWRGAPAARRSRPSMAPTAVQYMMGDAAAEPFIPAATAPVIRQGMYDTRDSVPIPAPVENGTIEFLLNVFQPGEYVSVAQEIRHEGRAIPDGGGMTFERDELVGLLRNVQGDPNSLWSSSYGTGVFVRINPMKSGGEADVDVTAYRHALIEWDRMPIADQWTLITQSRIPIACAIKSGGKSIHAWVRIDAESYDEYRERVELLYSHFAKYNPDRQNCNPSRLSRLPGARRGEAIQEIISLRAGAESWASWLEFLEDADLAPRLDVDRLMNTNWDDDPANVIGFRYLCRGSGCLIIGQSGVGKSTYAMQYAVCLAVGRAHFGQEAVGAQTVLIIQAENDEGDIGEMLQGVRQGMVLTDGEMALLRRNLAIVRDTTSAGPTFLARAERYIRYHRAQIVFADPLVSYIGGDISRSDAVAAFLRNGGLNDILFRTNAVWFWMHHTGKPPSDKKTRAEWTESDYSYLGLGSSDLTNWARAIQILIEMKLPDGDMRKIFRLIATKRGGRAGFIDTMGQRSKSLYLQHSSVGICWNQVPPPIVDEMPEYSVPRPGQDGGGRQARRRRRDSSAATATREMIVDAYNTANRTLPSDEAIASVSGSLGVTSEMVWDAISGGTP